VAFFCHFVKSFLSSLYGEFVMTTHFISAEFDANESPKQLQREIEAELEKRGEPLRWAVTDANPDKVQVEAVVTRED